MPDFRITLVLLVTLLSRTLFADSTSSSLVLRGFEPSPFFQELTTSFTVSPGIYVHMNAPGTIDTSAPTRLILYALPNGNTTSQTIGRAQAPDIDWHYFIQHIGAQTRRLREISPSENIIVAYLEAERRSWPSWKSQHSDHGAIIRRLIEELRSRVAPLQSHVEYFAHSGGGTLLFGLLDDGTTATPLPPSIRRIVLLDANYAFDTARGHGIKLANWLGDSDHSMVIACYDDRRITLDGKPVLKNPDNGTYSKTLQTLAALKSAGIVKDDSVTSTTRDAVTHVRALDGRLHLLIHANPENKILHTVLVERNGFVYGATAGTSLEVVADPFWGEAGYTKWIQP